jgi:hypothetical protein
LIRFADTSSERNAKISAKLFYFIFDTMQFQKFGLQSFGKFGTIGNNYTFFRQSKFDSFVNRVEKVETVAKPIMHNPAVPMSAGLCTVIHIQLCFSQLWLDAFIELRPITHPGRRHLFWAISVKLLIYIGNTP